jgi:predicted RecA/RadA family phage recombinase
MVAVPKHGWDGSYHEITCTVDAGATATKGYFAEGAAGGVKNLAAAGNRTMGVFKESAAAGAEVVVYTSGVFTITATAGDDFDAGEEVYPNIDGTVIDGVTGDYPCGAAVKDFAAGGSSHFLLVPSAFHFCVTAHA